MAFKTIFISNENVFEETEVEYNFYPGFAVSQKQKSIQSLHNAIKTIYPGKAILEVSTKSPVDLGVKLSAFNLRLDGRPLECVFQSSKVFSKEGQFKFLLDKSPIEAKHYVRDNAKSPLKEFNYMGKIFPLFPKSFFYDYIYIKALSQIPSISNKLVNYDIFTDIEFNSKKSINCQARSCVIYCYLLKNDCLNEYLNDLTKFKSLYSKAALDLFNY